MRARGRRHWLPPGETEHRSSANGLDASARVPTSEQPNQIGTVIGSAAYAAAKACVAY